MGDKRDKYGYALTFSERYPKGAWVIYDREKDSFPGACEEVLFSAPYDAEWKGDGPPPAVRAEYERLIEYKPEPRPVFNIVEMLAGDEDSAFDQPCKFGHRVDGHAVYCHNQDWLYAPRKCRRTWYTGGETRDEDCEGFSPNLAKEEQPCPKTE